MAELWPAKKNLIKVYTILRVFDAASGLRRCMFQVSLNSTSVTCSESHKV